jgi:hypothetical protein
MHVDLLPASDAHAAFVSRLSCMCMLASPNMGKEVCFCGCAGTHASMLQRKTVCAQTCNYQIGYYS